MIPPIRPAMMNIVFSAFSGGTKGEKLETEEQNNPENGMVLFFGLQFPV